MRLPRGPSSLLRKALGVAQKVHPEVLFRSEVHRPLVNGIGLALIVGGGIWLVVTGHPLALAMVFLGTALYLTTQARDDSTQPRPPTTSKTKDKKSNSGS